MFTKNNTTPLPMTEFNISKSTIKPAISKKKSPLISAGLATAFKRKKIAN